MTSLPYDKRSIYFDVFFYRFILSLNKYLIPCIINARIFSSLISPKEHLLSFWNMLKAQLARPVKNGRQIVNHVLYVLINLIFEHSPTNFKTSIFANLNIFMRNLWKIWANCTTSVSQYCMIYSNKFLHSYF